MITSAHPEPFRDYHDLSAAFFHLEETANGPSGKLEENLFDG